MSGFRPKEITNAERSGIVYHLMEDTIFGDDICDSGLTRLKKKEIIDDAYPLHDGKWEWSDEGPLNHRQVGHML